MIEQIKNELKDNIIPHLKTQDLQGEHDFKYLKQPAFNVFDQKRAFISLDNAFIYVGDNSQYQKRATKVLSLQWALNSFVTMGMPFVFSSMIEYQKTNLSFNPNNSLIESAATLFFIGSSLGAVIYPHVSDAIGRKKSMIIALLLSGLSMCGCGLSHRFFLFRIFLFIAGTNLAGFEVISLVYVNEISGERFRNFSVVSMNASWALAQIIFVLITMFMTFWRYLCIFSMGLPLLLSIYLTHYLLDETPRYLVRYKRYNEARMILRKMSTYNQRPPFEFNLYEEMAIFNKPSDDIFNMNKYQYSYAQLQRGYNKIVFNRKYFIQTVILIFFWFNRYFIYYGIQFSLQSIGLELRVSFLFAAVAEIVASVVGVPIRFNMLRKQSLYFSLGVIAFSAFSQYFISDQSNCRLLEQYNNNANILCKETIFSLILVVVMKFGITLFIVILITYTSELYPTSLRQKALGVCVFIGRFGSMLVPLYIGYMRVNDKGSLQNMSILAVVSMLLVQFLDETKNKNMVEDFEDHSSSVSSASSLSYISLQPRDINFDQQEHHNRESKVKQIQSLRRQDLLPNKRQSLIEMQKMENADVNSNNYKMSNEIYIPVRTSHASKDRHSRLGLKRSMTAKKGIQELQQPLLELKSDNLQQ